VKFTPDGGVVRIGLARVSDFVDVTVRDNGQGISPDFLPHVFEAFRQADGSTTRAHGGLGLGLSIVKHLVEAHGGMVQADSAGPGHGATFVVRFPIDPACAALAQHHLPPSNAVAPHVESASLDGLHILVIDDDEESRLMVAEHLEGRGAVVLVAPSAADAYDVLRRERVDGLLADIAMPGEDGYTFIRRIRAGLLPESTRVPAAALTALTRKEDRQLALDAGFEMHIAKPVEPDALVSAVAALVRNKATSLVSPQAGRS
jgi:CheY-like chemotaxis protein